MIGRNEKNTHCERHRRVTHRSRASSARACTRHERRRKPPATTVASNGRLPCIRPPCHRAFLNPYYGARCTCVSLRPGFDETARSGDRTARREKPENSISRVHIIKLGRVSSMPANACRVFSLSTLTVGPLRLISSLFSFRRASGTSAFFISLLTFWPDVTRNALSAARARDVTR